MPEFKVFGENIIIKADKVEQINGELLYQAVNEPEVFLIRDDKKCWIQNEVTYEKLGLKWDHPINKLELADLNAKYKTGDTILWKDGEFVVGDKPRDIYFPQEKMFNWVRGLVTLSRRPSAEEAVDLGFNLTLPFADLIDEWPGKIISSFNFDPNDERVIAHIICDEPDCHEEKPEDVWAGYEDIRKRSDKPIGCIFCGGAIGCGHEPKEYWLPLINKLDFVMGTFYVYADWVEEGKEMEELARCLDEEWKEVTVPKLPILQAHWTKKHRMRMPNPKEEVKFVRDRGLGYLAYPWRDEASGVSDDRDRWREANKL